MKLSTFTHPASVDLAIPPGDKEAVISAMVALLSNSPSLTDAESFLNDVKAREELVTTGVGYGVAFPHAKSNAIKNVVFAFGRTTEGVDFAALDGKPVRLVFLIGAPKEPEPSGVYLNLMARLSFLMKEEGNRDRLLEAKSAGDVLELLDSVK